MTIAAKVIALVETVKELAKMIHNALVISNADIINVGNLWIFSDKDKILGCLTVGKSLTSIAVMIPIWRSQRRGPGFKSCTGKEYHNLKHIR